MESNAVSQAETKPNKSQQGFSYLNSVEAVKPPIKKRKPPAPEPNYPKCTAMYEVRIFCFINFFIEKFFEIFLFL